MQLLVSVADASEARAALAGGADLIDAKNPRAGALGAVAPERLRRIHAAVRGARVVTAALGDGSTEHAAEAMAHDFASRGAALLKIGFAGTRDARRVRALLRAAVRGCEAAEPGRSGMVAVCYGDAGTVTSAAPHVVIEAAASCGARGVLVDTADKSGAGLTSLHPSRVLARWAAEAHDAGLFIALAGRLSAADLTVVRDAGADIAGVRGAACAGGRLGRVSAAKVRALRAALTA